MFICANEADGKGVTFRTESTAALDKEGLDRQATEKVRSVVLAVDPLSRTNLGALLAAPMPGTYPVLLHVYDLTASDLLGTNSLLRELGTGLFHTTLEVHGLEWSFGHCEHGTGIFSEEHGAGIFSDEELKGDLGFHQVRTWLGTFLACVRSCMLVRGRWRSRVQHELLSMLSSGAMSARCADPSACAAVFLTVIVLERRTR